MQAPKRHEKLWFGDGNVVLLAENTAFKVHCSILAQHSTVFADLFELSQPGAGAAEELDDVPMIRLAFDDPQEMADLLATMHHGLR